jgi:hypothetical protein
MRAAVSRRSVLVLATLGWAGANSAAQAAPMSLSVPLTGTQQVPSVQTEGNGSASLTYDSSTRVLTWSITYNGLSSSVTMAHIHLGAAGKNGPVVFWLSKRGTPVSSPITGEATLTPDQAQQFSAGEWYINVHTKDHPGGEIRGQITPPKA